MPTLKSAAKRMRTSEKARVANLLVATQIRNTRRALFEALDARNADQSSKLFRGYCVLLDKSAKKGVIKKNTAIRRKARASDKLRALKAG
ncbi:MAG: 30S ribosomal protein S20 [Verrucomicrobia bacterium]|nr:30S ribosomal protein S20 [Verrucomicrobiota bacterium]MBU1908638.1 30S ribosomal protein S20 [Verrucomicrobiota bacterium]